MTELGPGSEFDLIRAMRARWGRLAVGLGDDAAMLPLPRGELLVASADAAVDGVHFRREWLTPREIGYRAVAAALSDLAAMAAAPRGILVSFTLPSGSDQEVAEIADGIGEAAATAGTVIVGGNVSRGDRLSITTTVLGSAFSPVTRAGARPGDLLYVTGALGGARAALRALQQGSVPAGGLRERFARPRPRLAEARWLAARGAVAAIDVSDGLMSDAAHLAAASAAAIEIRAERVPVFAGATPEDALASGEEYELLVAARAALDETAFTAAFGVPLTPIGRVLEHASSGDAVRLLRDGERVAAPRGHDHLSV